MRSFTFSTAALIAILLALATLTTAQLDAIDSVSQPFERTLDDAAVLSERSLLEARQSTNTTSSSSSSAPASTATGSAPAGGDATITEPTCSMTNHLAVNQQASWGNGFINTCCGFAKGTQCWYRNQNAVSSDLECEIPNCADLESEDAARMIGFVPLNSTNGSGKYGNIFLSLGMLSPAAMVAPMVGVVSVVAALVALMGAL